MSRNSAPCSLIRALPRSSTSQLTSAVIFLTGLSPLKTLHSSTTCPYQRTFCLTTSRSFSRWACRDLWGRSALWPPGTSGVSTLRSSSLRWRPCAARYWVTARRKNWLRSTTILCSSSSTVMPHSRPGVSLSAALLHGSTTTSVQPKGNCDVLRELRIAPDSLFTGRFLWSSATPWRRFTEPPNVTICATRYVTARPLGSCTASPSRQTWLSVRQDTSLLVH